MQNKQAPDFVIGSLPLAIARLLGFLSLIVIFTPIHVVYGLLRRNDSFRTALVFHRYLVKLLGFRVRVHGSIATNAPVLFVANHSSYLDIPVLGMLIPAAFVAKAELAGWPLFGTLAKLQRTVFIERRAIRIRDQKDGMKARLEKGQNLILFPEGTSSDGLHVLPFRSGLFATVQEAGADRFHTVQPVSIVCTELGGLPITRAWRPYYAWFGDMTLVGHLWNVFKIGQFTVDVMFHPAVSPAAFANRKELASWCQKQVAQGVEQCLTGRLAKTPDPRLVAAARPVLADAPQN